MEQNDAMKAVLVIRCASIGWKINTLCWEKKKKKVHPLDREAVDECNFSTTSLLLWANLTFVSHQEPNTVFRTAKEPEDLREKFISQHSSFIKTFFCLFLPQIQSSLLSPVVPNQSQVFLYVGLVPLEQKIWLSGVTEVWSHCSRCFPTHSFICITCCKSFYVYR